MTSYNMRALSNSITEQLAWGIPAEFLSPFFPGHEIVLIPPPLFDFRIDGVRLCSCVAGSDVSGSPVWPCASNAANNSPTRHACSNGRVCIETNVRTYTLDTHTYTHSRVPKKLRLSTRPLTYSLTRSQMSQCPCRSKRHCVQ